MKLRPYECSVKGAPWGPSCIYAFTAGEAKAEYPRRVRDPWPDVKFTDIRCSVLPGLPSDDNTKSVADYRGVGVCIGTNVEFGKSRGVIVGANCSANFDVLVTAGEYCGLRMNVHPANLREATPDNMSGF